MIVATHGIVANSSITYDTDALAFFTATGITDNTQKNAVNTLVLDLKSYGIWSKLNAIYPIVGGSASTHKFNLKDPRDLNVAFRLTFVNGWTHSSTGALPNGTDAYADTNMNLNSNLSLINNHFSYYSRTNTSSISSIEMGVSSNISELPLVALSIKFTGDIIRSFNPDYTVSNISYSNNDSRGLFITNRSANNNHKIFKNSTLLTTNTSTITQSALPNANLFLAAYNYSYYPSTSAYSNREVAFSSIGQSMSDSEVSNFYFAVNKFQTTLGRNV